MMTIEQAIARVPQWGAVPHLSVTPLAESIMNLTYRVDAGGDVFIVRLAGRDSARLGIDRRCECQSAIAAGRTGVGPDVVECLPDDGILVTRFIRGRHLSVDDVARPEILGRVVKSLHTYHAGPPFAGRFSPFRALDAYLREARASGAPLPADIGGMYDQAAAIEAATSGVSAIVRPCHNDLWGPNLIDDGDRVRILDWEYAGMGDVYFDLANFTVHHQAAGDEALLRAYFGAASTTGLARLRLLEIAAELREAMWAMVAVTLPAPVGTGFDCLAYAATHFGRCRRALEDPRLRSWLRAAAQNGRP